MDCPRTFFVCVEKNKRAAGKIVERRDMEILNSGSFIPLEDREKVEQLIFTAQTLASEVSQNAGFRTSGQTNQQIGLELWNGAEYMTRAHEEVTIRNIFLSKFLERLRDLQREIPKAQLTPAPQAAPAIETADPMIASEVEAVGEGGIETVIEPQDEFLGVVEPEYQEDVRTSYADECKPEFEREIASMDDSSDEADSTEPNEIAAEERSVDAAADQDRNDVETQKVEETTSDQQISAVASGTSPIDPSEAKEEDIIESDSPIRSVVLTEKEPYNFHSCTITAVIQLLPQNAGARDCVVSVRSHDFAPQITFAAVNGDISSRISGALDQYRNALPVLAAEKVKKEQTSTRKRGSKTSPKTVDKSAVNESSTTEASISNPTTTEASKEQASLFAA